MKRKSSFKVILIILAIVCINKFMVSFAFIQSDLMTPALKKGAFVIIDKITFRFRPPKTGDIIIYKDGGADGQILIKRVIGVQDNLITIRNGNVYIDGQLLNEPYAKKNTAWNWMNVRIEKNYVYALEDNRTIFLEKLPDKQIPFNNILGKIIRIKRPEFKI